MPPITPEPATPADEVGYVFNGYPRLSEVFVSNEIHVLESMGLRFHIFAMKQPVEPKSQAVVQKIQAEVTYLPPVAPMKQSYFLPWLCRSLPQFVSSHVRLWRLRPGAYWQTLCEALRLSVQHRPGTFTVAKKTFLKEFLQAGVLALHVLKSGRVRHLHAHFAHGATTMTMFASRLCGLPFSFTAHAKDIYLPEQNPGNLLPTKIRRAQFVVTCTATNQAYLERLSQETPIYTVYHGLDTRRFQPSAPPPTLPELPLILSVGRCVEKKGFPYLVRACRLLKDRGYAFQCLIVGEPGEQTDMVQHLISDLQLEDTVVLHEAVTQEELRHIYQRSTVFALPCQLVSNGDRDGIPNVLVEAMAMQLSVVSTEITGIPELIAHRVNGLLVPQKDATALADALAEVLQDATLRRRLGKAARQRVCKHFEAWHTTAALHDLFVPRLETHDDYARQIGVS